MKKSKYYKTKYNIPKNFDKTSDRYLSYANIINSFSPKKVLDIGCGDGSLMKLIKKMNRKVKIFGLDIQPDNKKNIYKCDIDHEKIPSKIGKKFDVVFSGEIIEHLFDPDHLLSESHRVLNHNGILIITTPNLAAWFNRISLLLGYQPVFMGTSLKGSYGSLFPLISNGSHIRLYTLKALTQIIQANGFKILNIKGYGINPKVGVGAKLPILTHILNFIYSKTSLSPLLLVVAQKQKANQ